MSEKTLIECNLRIRVTDDPGYLDINGAQVPVEASGEVPPPVEPTPNPGWVHDFSTLFGFTFGRSDKGVNANVDLGMPTGSGGFRFVFYVGNEIALDAGVSDHGGYFTITTLATQLERWAEKVGDQWVPRQGYDDVVQKLIDTGLDDDQFGVFPKEGFRAVDLTGVVYDGRATRMEIYNRYGRWGTIKMNGAIPNHHCSLQLVQTGVTEHLQYVFD